MFRSLRSILLLSSILWTAGLLFIMHMISISMFHIFPAGLSHRNRGPMMFGIACMIAGVFALRKALRALQRVRNKLTSLRLGVEKRVTGSFPTEVQPLIDDLNALLEQREEAVKRAQSAAGDLAHGLKTPLALLAQEAESAEAAGNVELAQTLQTQVDRMSRQVNYHLARARAAASGSLGAGRCSVVSCAEAVVRTLVKIHMNSEVRASVKVDPDVYARLRQEDLEEILGNLIDNAFRWAKSKIEVTAIHADGTVTVMVDDDGPGLSPADRVAVLERGVRLDEASGGSGLGLAIVRDLAELYGGSVVLEDAPTGGVRACVKFPAAVSL